MPKAADTIRYFLHSLGFVFLGSGLPGFAATPPEPFMRSPYIQSASSNQIHVVWRTAGPIQPVVRYGENAQSLTGLSRHADIVTRIALGTNGEALPSRWEALRTKSNLRHPKLHSAPVGTFQ